MLAKLKALAAKAVTAAPLTAGIVIGYLAQPVIKLALATLTTLLKTL